MNFAREVRRESGESFATIEASLQIGDPGSRSGRTFWAYVHGERTMTRKQLTKLVKLARAQTNDKGRPWISVMTLLRIADQMRDAHGDERKWKALGRDHDRMVKMHDQVAWQRWKPLHEELRRLLARWLRFLRRNGRSYRADKELVRFRLEFPSETGREEVQLLTDAVREASEAALAREDNFPDDHFDLIRRVRPSEPREPPNSGGRFQLIQGGKS
jgi:ElaB/YqjD/DUF883 family membrane-anchored ribosome-binding protein